MTSRRKPFASETSVIFVVGDQINYATPFSGMGRVTNDPGVIKNNPDDVAFALFTGGEDVNPSIYGQRPGSGTRYNRSRDDFEVAMFHLIRNREIPCVGICRGSQFLCVMSGGKLAQDIENHGITGTHAIQTKDGSLIQVTSTHHQMQLPPDGAVLLAHAEPRLSSYYLNGNDQPIYPPPAYEYEGVYYPETQCLGMQWHPEYMSMNSPAVAFTRQLVEEYILAVNQSSRKDL